MQTSVSSSTRPPSVTFAVPPTAPSGRTSSCCSTWSSATCWSGTSSSWYAASPGSRTKPLCRFAGTLNAGTRPFHTINYVGSLGGIRVLGYARTERLMDRTIRTLQTSLDHSSDAELNRSMHFPVGWDPYFEDVMTIRDVYHYPTQHYDHHRRQLTLHHISGG